MPDSSGAGSSILMADQTGDRTIVQIAQAKERWIGLKAALDAHH